MVETPSLALGKIAPALCPTCNTPALYRSHTTSALEERRKKIGGKRPFRCHECGWRGWLDETSLRYATRDLKQKSRTAAQQDADIPEISLEEPLPAITPDRDTTTLEMTETGRDNRTKEKTAPQSAAQTGSANGTHRPEQSRPDLEPPAPEVHGSESLPEFDEGSGRPVSQKVSLGFHHHARHTVKACPKCAEPTLYRSRSRGFGELLRKKFTNKRPYRCHRCGWRGWMSKGF
ncbi:MAG: hypothetical protein JXA28_09320 [Bacteroidetes bacterium]|nr:hypothetical protein [Bacteroidota bacterium]